MFDILHKSSTQPNGLTYSPDATGFAHGTATTGTYAPVPKSNHPWATSHHGPDVRRCTSCGGEMVTNRYKRHFLRFIRCYRCDACGKKFEQETRGYQGFYIGLLAAVSGPIILVPAVLFFIAYGQVSPWQLAPLITFYFLALLPVCFNILRYRNAPVIWRERARILLRKESSRGLFGRILGGNSRVCGALLAISGSLFIFTTMFTAVALAAG